jgi:hypothetical protein
MNVYILIVSVSDEVVFLESRMPRNRKGVVDVKIERGVRIEKPYEFRLQT